MLKDIKALLFDIDGTVLDTREFIIQATQSALATCGYPAQTTEKISATAGKPFPDYYLILAGEGADAERLVKAHREFQYKNYHLVRPFPRAFEVLEKLSRQGYKLAAVTTRSSKTSHQTLIDAGIDKFFNVVISWEDVENHKPHPEPLLKALDCLGYKPEEAMMIGDSHIDIEAGKNAGTKTVRATYGFHKDKMHEPEPDYFIDDISELLKIL